MISCLKVCKQFVLLVNRDMAKPINVLTGLDYWLDNLMCNWKFLLLYDKHILIVLFSFWFVGNVPEVVMCYHLGDYWNRTVLKCD